MPERNVWGIHAGKTGDADTLFLKKNFIAIGWAKMGNLSTLAPERDAFKSKVLECYPDKKPGAIPNNAGQLYRFVHVAQVDDLVIYRSKRDHQIHIGRIAGNYKYDPQLEAGYPNLRPVVWLKTFPLTRFSQGALHEIGSAMSFFLVKNYADDFIAALEGAPAPAPAEDETVSLVAEEIEQTTRDFIIKQLAQELKGHPLEDFVAHLLNAMGYRTRVSPEGQDGGIDIIAHKDELGFEPPIVKVQVKSSEGNVGEPAVSALYGKVAQQNEFGLFVTLGGYTAQAISFARNKPNLRLIDSDGLVDLILQHYDQFDSRYKGLLPLKRVYIPEVFEETED